MVQLLNYTQWFLGATQQALSDEGVGGFLIVGEKTMCMKILPHFAFDSHDKKKRVFFYYY